MKTCVVLVAEDVDEGRDGGGFHDELSLLHLVLDVLLALRNRIRGERARRHKEINEHTDKTQAYVLGYLQVEDDNIVSDKELEQLRADVREGGHIR